MDLNDVRNLVTLFSFLLFVALVVWTWRPARLPAHESAALLPFVGEVGEVGEAGEIAAVGGQDPKPSSGPKP